MIYRGIVQQFRSNTRTKNRAYFPTETRPTVNHEHVWSYPETKKGTGGLIPQEILDDEDNPNYDDEWFFPHRLHFHRSISEHIFLVFHH